MEDGVTKQGVSLEVFRGVKVRQVEAGAIGSGEVGGAEVEVIGVIGGVEV